MGEADVQSQLRKIELTKADLDRTIDELAATLPPKDELVRDAKQVAAVGGAAIAAVVLGTAALRSRSRISERRKQARVNAEELVRAFRQVDDPEPETSSTKAWFAVGAGIAALGVAAWNRFGDA